MNHKHWFLFIALTAFLFTACQPSGKKAEEAETDEAPPAEASLNALTEEEAAAGWALLFDGESTDQWRGYCKDEFPTGWQIVDGTLQVIGSGRGEAGSGGDIITKKQYGNFELALEWKVSEGGNSGIFYLARERCGDEAQDIWKSAPEMQILDNVKHPDAMLGKDGNRQAGSLYDLIPANPQNAKPAGEWNQASVLVYNGTVVHRLNGENVVEYHLWTDDWKNKVANSKFKDYADFVDVAKEGHIGLQDHGDDVWFRNIKIRER